MAKIYRTNGEYDRAERLIHRATSAVEKTGNITKIVKLGQSVAEIRQIKQVVYLPTDKKIY